MTRLIGYARVSTDDQDTSIQKDALKKAGCDIVLDENESGASRKKRKQLDLAIQILGKGDALVVTRIDRLARSMKDLQDIVYELKAKGAALRATEQPIDTSSASGKAFLDMLGVFAEFETSLRRERQMEGIAKIKADPKLRKLKYRGRPPANNREAVWELASQDRGPSYIAAKLNIHRVTVHRILKERNNVER